MHRIGIGMGMGLNGFGCSCAPTLKGVADYDQITIGGKAYSANQILDKTITAARDTKYYTGPGFANSKLMGTIKAGQPIGVVFSYLKPSQTGDGRGWLQIETTYNKYFFVPNEAVAPKPLQDQGALTVAEETKIEQEAAQRENEPILYYFKKIGVPVLLTAAGIYIAVQIGKAVIEKKL